MNSANLIPVLLLVLISAALVSCIVMFLLVQHWRKENRRPPWPEFEQDPESDFSLMQQVFAYRPACWLAIRSRNLDAVQAALGVNNAKPCTWLEGFTGDQKLFIAPPVNGWILVMGSGLPDPAEDVDDCFQFLLQLSRQLGQVQFFAANRALGHHAWARAEAGRIQRAYAWAGKTIWNQGIKTRAELELRLKCFRYLEAPERISFAQPDVILMNTEKVPLLAARWSVDPAAIDERLFDCANGIAGEPDRSS